MDVKKLRLLYEGKAKKLYQTAEDSIVLVEYKDDATAFNGEKKAQIVGKGRLNNEITSLIFSKLHTAGIKTHFIGKLSENEQLVKHVSIIPLEVVVRNVVAGGFSKRVGIEEGTDLVKPIVEFYYKNDDLGDPLVNEDHIEVLSLATKNQVLELKEQALKINDVLRTFFLDLQIRLIDFKLEFGVTKDGKVLLADEISPDTCRFWDIETNEKLDKDVFRRDLGNVTDAYTEILNRLGGQFACTK
jgi:phosphoribosylaminoimidazole-succinocarboxamide synthase